MSKPLKFPNTPLQQLKKQIEQALFDVKKYPVVTDISKALLFTLETTLEELEKFENEDQKMAEDANSWSWRHGEDMGR